KPSELEQDLGAQIGYPSHGDAQGHVCALGSPYGTRNQFWVGLNGNQAVDYNPEQIVADRLPYFYSNRQELFAELFVTEIYGTYGTNLFLTFTDGVLHNDAVVDA